MYLIKVNDMYLGNSMSVNKYGLPNEGSLKLVDTKLFAKHYDSEKAISVAKWLQYVLKRLNRDVTVTFERAA